MHLVAGESHRPVRAVLTALLLAVASILATGARAQPAVEPPPLATFVLTEDRLVGYILAAVDMAAEQLALQQRYGIPTFAADLDAAFAAAGATAEANALLVRHGFADAAEFTAFVQAIAQALLFIQDPDNWARVMGPQLPPQQNVDLVATHYPELAAVGPAMMALIEPGTGRRRPAWALNPYPLTPDIVAVFGATQPAIDPPVIAIFDRLNIVPEAAEYAPVGAALEAAGALGEVNAILAPFGYANLEEWYGINLAIAQAFGWIIYARGGLEADYFLPAPPPANVMAVTPYFDTVDALGIYTFTLPR